MNGSNRGLSRRAFVRSAVAIGGASALAACLQREETEDVPQAALSPAELPDRQHAWNEFLATDDHGNIEPPEHHLLLGLEYVGDGPADADDEREQLEAAFRTLETAYKRGNEGLAFTIGYGPAYFDRFEAALPESVDLPAPEALAPIEDPELDEYDALVHLASDYGHVTLSAEEALKGELEELNGLAVEDSFEGVFDVGERRTGFIGRGLPAERQSGVSGIPDSEPVPEDAPMFMGFKSGFRKTQATEDRVTIEDGPFAGGTTVHLSKIRLHLHQWYEQDSRDIRVSKMFSPAHADDGLIDGAGDNLGDSSRVAEVGGDAVEAARSGTVGHAQKAARAREDGEPIILRRDFDSTDDDAAATHFLSLHRSIADFVKTREAMTGSDLTEGSVSSRTNNGILQYIRVRNRANYLVPPRGLRALPEPNPDSA